jgi:hypothetical protein
MKVGKRGDARNMPAASGGSRVPMCATCNISIRYHSKDCCCNITVIPFSSNNRGPFVSALDKTWCPNHFVCANPQCSRPLIDVGFVEEAGQLFCENDYRMYFAPRCGKCGDAIIGVRAVVFLKQVHLWSYIIEIEIFHVRFRQIISAIAQ